MSVRSNDPDRPYRLGRVALEVADAQWDLDVQQWSDDELRHAIGQLKAEAERRKRGGR